MSSSVVGSVAEVAKTEEDAAASGGGADSGSGSGVRASRWAAGEEGTVPAWPVICESDTRGG
jgi:hypothetical protein